ISDKIKIAAVITPGTTRPVISGLLVAQILVASCPTPIAPTVWAIVFNVRIAASGRSILSLKSFRIGPSWPPSFNPICIYDGEMPSQTAYHREHRHEITIDIEEKTGSGPNLRAMPSCRQCTCAHNTTARGKPIKRQGRGAIAGISDIIEKAK